MIRIVALAFALSLSSNLAAADMHGSPAEPATPAVEKVEILDINTATEVQLKALPGISEDHVKNIIENRPYSNKEELKSKGIIPHTVYELIKDRISAIIKAERQMGR